MRRHAAVASILLAAAALAPSTARAQEPAVSAGPLVVEELRSGLVIAPENRFTDLDGSYGNLIGGHIGFLTDDTVMLGAGGYWLSDGSRARELEYGGLVAYWSPLRSDRFSVSVGGLVGAGRATLDVQVDGVLVPTRGFDGRFGRRDDRFRSASQDEAQSATRTFLVRRDFFVAEPQARAALKLTRWLQLGVGVGYRFVNGADSLDDRLRGVSGSVSLQLGTF